MVRPVGLGSVLRDNCDVILVLQFAVKGRNRSDDTGLTSNAELVEVRTSLFDSVRYLRSQSGQLLSRRMPTADIMVRLRLEGRRWQASSASQLRPKTCNIFSGFLPQIPITVGNKSHLALGTLTEYL